jgi:acetyltransferase
LINNIHGLNATFADAGEGGFTGNNSIAFISQSGAIGSAVLDRARSEAWGLSYFVSLGNKAVLDENDFLDYFKNDKRTKAVALYLEEIIDGRRFMRTVSEISKVKPVIVLKTGKTRAGQKATLSHTGSMAGSEEAVRAGLERSGAVVADCLKDFLNLINFWGQKKEVEIDNTFILSNAGGPLVATVDELEKYGLGLAGLSSRTEEVLKKRLKGITSNIANPLDIIGDADADRYEKTLEAVLGDSKTTNAVVILTPQTATEPEKTARVMVKLNKKYKNKQLVAGFIGGGSLLEAKKILQENGIPDFQYPGDALCCLDQARRYGKTVKKLKPYTYSQKQEAVSENKGQVDYLESFSILKKFGIPCVKNSVITDKKDLEKADYPLVLKAVGPDIIHKTDKNSLILDVENYNQAVNAWGSLSPLLNKKGNYCVAQPLISKGVEMIVGFRRDDSFGPIIVVGAGGTYTEIMQDIRTEVDDVNLSRAMTKIKQLQIHPLLAGARGQRGYDIKALARAVVNMAKLAKKNPEIKEVDINPLFVTEKGVIAVDARMIY